MLNLRLLLDTEYRIKPAINELSKRPKTERWVDLRFIFRNAGAKPDGVDVVRLMLQAIIKGNEIDLGRENRRVVAMRLYGLAKIFPLDQKYLS